MTKIHGKASSVSYGRRYLMCMMFNIPTGDDNDGNNSQVVEYIDDSELGVIEKQIKDLNVNRSEFLKYMKVESLLDITKSNYKKAITALKTKAAQEGKK